MLNYKIYLGSRHGRKFESVGSSARQKHDFMTRVDLLKNRKKLGSDGKKLKIFSREN